MSHRSEDYSYSSGKRRDMRSLISDVSTVVATINATDHAVMRHFHKPEDEKRMVVILPEADYDRWLQAPNSQTSDFLIRYPAEALEAEPAPRPPARRGRAQTDPATPSLI